MTTIKEFANLCGCSTQTLRYYDKIDLLKPVKVDQWSGYRYYAKSQAIDFVKIKNLQAADFSIGEIKALLPQSDQLIYEAFEQKITEQEQKLERIREIRQSYLKEKNSMEKLIGGIADFMVGQLNNFEGLKEFGLSPEDGADLIEMVRSHLEKWIAHSAPSPENVTLTVNDEVYHGLDAVTDKVLSLTSDNLEDKILFGDESVEEEKDFSEDQCDSVWECHGWEHVYEFIDNIPDMKSGWEYCFLFRLNERNYSGDIAYPLFMLGAMLLKRGDDPVGMSCTTYKSDDQQNHFKLLRFKLPGRK